MLKKFWYFIKRIFGRKKRALPEGATTCYSGEFSSAICHEENFESILQDLEPKDENVINIEEIEQENNVEEIIEEKVEENSELGDFDELLDFASEICEIDENITNLLELEFEEPVVVAEASEVAAKMNEASNVEVIESNVIVNNIYEETNCLEEDDENLAAIIHYISLLGFSKEDIKILINKNPEITRIDSDIVVDNLNYLTSVGLNKSQLYEMIKESPELLTNGNVRYINEKVRLLREKKIESSIVHSLYVNNPNIILLETRQVEQSLKIIKKFYRTKDRIRYIIKYFPHVIGMTNLAEIRKYVEKI